LYYQKCFPNVPMSENPKFLFERGPTRANCPSVQQRLFNPRHNYQGNHSMNERVSKKCSKSGCKAFKIAGSDYCFAHDPARAFTRKQEQKRGGLTRSAPKIIDEIYSLQTIPQVKDMLERVTNASLRGEIDLSRARTAGYLASLILTCLKDYDLEKRMEELEKKLAEVEHKKGR
jgi:hypothetical protein